MGLAHAAALATPWNQQPAGWLQLLALGTLVWLLTRCSAPRQAAWLGWTFATAWLSGTFWWLFVAMHTYAGLPAPLAALAVLLLAAVLALYYAAACSAFVALALKNKGASAIVFAALWLLAEMARGIWFTGFGWGAAGYAHLDSALAGYAPWVGAYGMTALAAGLAAAGAIAITSRGAERWRPVIAVALALGVGLGLGQFPHLGHRLTGDAAASTGALRVALLQGNIAQDEKFQPGTGVVDALRWYGEQLQTLTTSQASLVVAPETALPVLIQQLPEGYWAALTRHYTQGTQAALIGVPMGNNADGYTNAVIGLQPGQPGESATATAAHYRYDKHHLVPFGEFIPPGFRWFTEMMEIPLGDFKRGDVGQASMLWQGQRLAPNVCYEDLFGEELGARFIATANAPTIFVNVSNIGWFGNTVAIDQHVQISRMRTLEFARPMIRATNTGDTVIIDHTGHITHALPRVTRGVLLGEVQGRSGTTPFAWWVARFGLWPMWVLAVAVVALASAGALRKR
jgi:apolipoprotein N-acyltransferase